MAPDQLDHSVARLLPWVRDDGAPCYLVTDGHGPVSRMADEMERMQIRMAVEIQEYAHSLVEDADATVLELRFAATRLSECLTDALRIAESRGGRLERERMT
ncbi:hypothetical protein [Streptomyces sp. NBC_00102]|uniref:hypothetical protein n=1 Tax=Streptomyces sp. NBC_00102 TaxID=2975652 RepID=UPI0022520CA8|nr:hypothetical protein [Streptomyces sp. NBC_00102]MCX5398880.1 hypothetical protein [Streptomyces sp. NBC_00102]